MVRVILYLSHNHSLNVLSYSLTNIILKIPEGFDRTAAGRSTRAQMSQDLAKAINDGLTFYEEGLWLNDGEDEEGWIECTGSSASDHERTNVNIISQEDFAKIRQTRKDAPTYYQRPPAPPPTAANSTLPSPITTYNAAVAKQKVTDEDLDMQFQVNLSRKYVQE